MLFSFKSIVIFIFFAYKKYSRRFIKFRLNHWWQMDYFVFHTFLGLDSGIYLAVNGTVTNLLVFILNILNCVLKTNEAFMGLERHGGKWLMTTFLFWGGVILLLSKAMCITFKVNIWSGHAFPGNQTHDLGIGIVWDTEMQFSSGYLNNLICAFSYNSI